MAAAIPAPPSGVSRQTMWGRLVRSERRAKNLKAKGGSNPGGLMGHVGNALTSGAMGAIFARYPNVAKLGGRFDTRLAIIGVGVGFELFSKKGLPFPMVSHRLVDASVCTYSYEAGAALATGGSLP